MRLKGEFGYNVLTQLEDMSMRAKSPEEMAEIKRLRQELKIVKKQLADEILDHRIDIATLEVASEIYHFDPVALKKKNDGTKSPID